LIKADAELICRKEPFGAVADWKGDPRKGVARVSGMLISEMTKSKRIPVGLTFKVGGLRLRVVEFPVIASAGVGYADAAHVMLESPHAELYALYRRAAEAFLRAVCNVEARVRGFLLQDIHNRQMEFTAKLAGWIL
jgi:hypothetical protein